MAAARLAGAALAVAGLAVGLDEALLAVAGPWRRRHRAGRGRWRAGASAGACSGASRKRHLWSVQKSASDSSSSGAVAVIWVVGLVPSEGGGRCEG